jgi:sialic acid synthase SpsE
VVQDVKAGDVVTLENVRAIRPGGGCAPKYLKVLLGAKFNENYEAGTAMSIDLTDI